MEKCDRALLAQDIISALLHRRQGISHRPLAMSSSSALQLAGSPMFDGMYMVLPEPPAVREFLLDDDQLPKSPRVLADEAKPSATQNTDGDDDTSKPDGQHRGQRRPAEDRWDCGQYWGKRHRKNQPSDVSDETWASGVSETPVAGWQKLQFMYVPPSAWKTCEVFVHATTTAADVKYHLQSKVGMPHHQFCVFGLQSQQRLPFTEELTGYSACSNWEPLEPRVLVPTSRVLVDERCGKNDIIQSNVTCPVIVLVLWFFRVDVMVLV